MSAMKLSFFISMWTALGILQMLADTEARKIRLDPDLCEDSANWCRKLGRKIPLSRCYDPRHKARCCETCERLKLPITGCEYGDRDAALCHSIDKTRPVGDCYAFNSTCCQTCHLFDSGIPDCPYGDRVTWCSGIGDRYLVSSCYDHEIHCCDTCRQFRTRIPGCPYGDRLMWCSGIGDIYPISSCEEYADACCESCNRFRNHHSPTTPGTKSSSFMPELATPRATESTKTRPNSITNIHLANVTAASLSPTTGRHNSPSQAPATPSPSTPPVTINSVLTDTSPWQLHPSNHSGRGSEVSESWINSSSATKTTLRVPESVNNRTNSLGKPKDSGVMGDITASPQGGSSRQNVTNTGSAGHTYSSTVSAGKVSPAYYSTPSPDSGVQIYTADTSDIDSDKSETANDATHPKETHLNEISSTEEKKARHNEAISQGVSSGCRMLHRGSSTQNSLLVVISLVCVMAGHFTHTDHNLWR